MNSIERKIVFREEPVTNDHNANTAVNRIIFNITDSNGDVLFDRGYYLKFSDDTRSNNMGDVTYEAHGYEIMEAMGVNIPGYRVGTKDGRIALATTPVHGTALHTETQILPFEQRVDDVLEQNYNMWVQSATLMRTNPEAFIRIRRSCPVTEALGTGERMSLYLGEAKSHAREQIPRDYVDVMNTVMGTLRSHATAIAQSDHPPFFQHGDEILSNFIFDSQRNKMAVIDPTPRMSTRMERALNKMLGGSLIFNMQVGNDGQPVDKDKFGVLTSVVKKYNDMINEYYQEVSPEQQSSLREILFVNLSRIYFGIYNKENADHIDVQNKSKYLHLAMQVYDIFS